MTPDVAASKFENFALRGYCVIACVHLGLADTRLCCIVAAMLHVIQLLGAPIYVLRVAYIVPLTIGIIFGCLHQFVDSRQVIGAVLHLG